MIDFDFQTKDGDVFELLVLKIEDRGFNKLIKTKMISINSKKPLVFINKVIYLKSGKYDNALLIGDKLLGWQVKDHIFYKFKSRGFSLRPLFASNLLDLQSKSYFFLPPVEAELLNGLLFGAQGIKKYPVLYDKFNSLSLTHIIALSGYNISLIILFFRGIFCGFSYRAKQFLVIIGIIFFFFLVNGDSSVLRASIMGCLNVLILMFGFKYLVFDIVFLTFIFMIILNPVAPYFDIGFQLSFLALLGILFCADFITKYVKFLPKIFGIQESFVMTMAAQVFVLPFVWWHFQTFNIFFVLVNIIASFLIPFAMFFGFVAICFAYFNLFFAKIVGGGAYVFLRLIILLVNLF